MSLLRPLTAGEHALAQEMFGEGLDASRVRILAIPLWKRAFVAGPGLIVWPARSLPTDFGAAPLRLQATFVHELAHVWQAQNGARLLIAKLKAGDGPAAYAYDLTADLDFVSLNIEQQATVVEHAFLASRGAPVPRSPADYAALSAAWRA